MIFAMLGLAYTLTLFVRAWKFGIRDVKYTEMISALGILILALIFLSSIR